MSSLERNRRYKRYYYKTSIMLDEAKDLSLESINISQGGIFFRSSELLELNKSVSITFSLPGQKDNVEAKCSVIHNLETIPSRQYFVGVKFEKISDTSLNEFGNYLSDYFEKKEI